MKPKLTQSAGGALQQEPGARDLLGGPQQVQGPDGFYSFVQALMCKSEHLGASRGLRFIAHCAWGEAFLRGV